MSKTNTNVTENLRKQIEAAVTAAMEQGALPAGEIPSFVIEEPADRSHGDIATNVAMAGARVFRMAPVKAAQIILDHIDLENSFIEKCEIAGPGFINFFLSKRYFAAVLREIENEGERYGESDYGQGKKVMVEFVSANPTGPMHLGNARGGALGDCLAAVLDKAGYQAYREFYVNDAGNQIEKFAASLEARYMQLFDENFAFPEDGYQGSDIIERAEQFKEKFGGSLTAVSSEERRRALVDFALPLNIKRMQDDMAKYKIDFDNWFMESTLHESGSVAEVVNTLTEKGLTYEKDGAIWYKNKDICTEILLSQGKKQDYIDKLELKDDVLIRSNGNPTYFAADIAYHKNKFDRGFEQLINVWGADHHGHVMRLKGAMNAIGYDGDKLDILLMQLVKLVRDGQIVTMSKRTGKAIQLRDLLDEVPVDSARFIFNTREATTQMDFDLDLAIQQDSQNPVYYVQYAHARICSILRNLEAEGVSARSCTDEELCLLGAPEEVELIHLLSAFDSEIIAAARDYDPTKITKYVTNVATYFHKFYNACRVKCDDEKLMQARLSLCTATKTVIKNVLDMFSITCPDRM
ncbi:arginine--tRNA ligase [Ruminococcus sp.]|uniref:arginine--tRNA ligase n=1 Tax=Ruminococcus sp. TaxID=41978 RepID=UPI002E8196CB|nr:arginine--tRNA ligase [Ruminococcus sp.]MEE3491728.1 arginine--tRNA ligase [Ruminococcus sp.]